MRTPQSHLSASDLKNQLPKVSQIARDLFSIEFKHNVAKCPLTINHNHGDRDPSLRYDRKKNRIFCASQQCFGESGADAFKLVQTLENCSFQEARTRLSNCYGLTAASSSSVGVSSTAGKASTTRHNPAPSLAAHVRERLKRDGFEAKAEYSYSPLLRKIRFEHASELQPGKQKPKKDFRWEHCVSGVWYSGDGGLPKPLYVNRRFRETERLDLVVGFEGEGKAEAAAELGIAGFSFKNITHAQARELVGCTVVLWPDNDDSGRKQVSTASEVIAACDQVREVKELTPPDEFPASADIVDVISKLGWDCEKILEFVRTARPLPVAEAGCRPAPEGFVDALGRADSTSVSPFRISTEGVFFLKPSEDGSNAPIWLSAPVHVIAQTRDSNGSNWGRLLRWRDNEGREHEWVMPMELLASDATAVRARLLSDGLPSITTNGRLRERLIEYLQTAPAERCLRTTSKVGWHGGAFVLPDQVFTPNDGEDILYQGTDDGIEGWGVRGTLQDWREHIGTVCSGNSRLILAVSSAFAGPVLGLTKSESGGIHLFGPSSTGKTTALLVGASVCGGGSNGRVRTWRATMNGLEAVACSHNDSTLFIDEISQVDPAQVSETAYLLANGRGKLRMTKSISSRRALSWNLLFISAGEITLAEHAASVGRSTKAGVGVRLLNVPADAGRGFGLFEDLHGACSPQAFVLTLRDAASKFYGTPLRAFLSRLIADRAAIDASLTNAQTKVNEVIPAGVTGQVLRAAERFSLIGAVGELATDWGITGWKKGEGVWAAQQCLIAWIQSRGTTGDTDAETGVRRVRAFLETHGQSRFPWMNSSGAPNEPLIRDRAGFRRRAADQSAADYLIFRDTFREEICSGLDYRVVAKELKNRGFLLCDTTGYTIKPRLPGMGIVRVFCVLGSILESEEC